MIRRVLVCLTAFVVVYTVMPVEGVTLTVDSLGRALAVLALAVVALATEERT